MSKAGSIRNVALVVAVCSFVTGAFLALTSCNVRSSGGPVQLFEGPVGDVALIAPRVVEVGHPVHWRVFPSAPSGAKYVGIAPDPTGNYMWFSDVTHDSLVRMAMDGSVKSYPLTTSQGAFAPGFFAFGANGGIYIGGCLASKCDVVGIMAPGYNRFSIVRTPSGDGPGQANQFVLGPDKGVWFVEQTHIAEIVNRSIKEYASPQTPLGPNIVVGGDGNIWFDGQLAPKGCLSGQCPFIGHIGPSGANVTTFPLGFYSGSYYVPYGSIRGGMATGANGNVFVLAEKSAYYCSYYCYDFLALDEVSPNGDQTAFQFRGYSGPVSNTVLTATPDGSMWWAKQAAIVKYALAARPYRHDTPDGGTPVLQALGGDGNIWAVDDTGNVLVFLLNVLGVRPTRLTLPAPTETAVLEVHYSGRSPISAASDRPFIATVKSQSGSDFLVTAVHRGTTTIIVQDTQHNSFLVPVTVN